MKKSILTSIVAGLAVMVFTASAYAVPQRVALKTTVPNIPKSACYQAGTVSLEFDLGTTMAAGDVIQFTLNNGVRLCRNIDFFIPLDVDAATGFTVTNGTPAPAGAVGFRVKGTAGSLIVTMTLGSLDAADAFVSDPLVAAFEAEVTADPSATIALFNKAIVNSAGDDILKDDSATTTATDYVTVIDPEDNVICIDTLTFDYQGERVEVTPDSIVAAAANKLTFTGEREIARILDAAEYDIVPCKTAAKVGNIPLPEEQEDCPPFDFETGSGYCLDTHFGNQIIIQAQTNPFPTGTYQVTLEVKVNGLTGDQGVYIAGNTVGYATSGGAIQDICGLQASNIATLTSFVAPGACSQETNVVPGGHGCTVDCINKVVKATTTGKAIVGPPAAAPLVISTADHTFLKLDLPSFRYDSSIVKEGDVVSVNVTVAQYPCGNIISEDIVIGTFGCTPPTRETTLLYPYFTPANGSYFWSAYAITNISGADGTVTLYMYESDGDAFTGEVGTPVKAHTIWATRLDDSIVNPDITWTQTAGTGTPGDAMCYIEAKTSFTADGFGFIAGSPTGESMGYLPRVNGKY